MNKIKSVIIDFYVMVNKYINPFLLMLSAVLLFAHYFFKDNTTAWYVRDIEKNLSIILLTFFIFRIRIYKHGLLNILYKCFLWFILIKNSFNIVDENLALIYKIHIHKLMLIIQSVPLSIICLIAVYNLLKGDKWIQKDCK